MKLKNTLLVSVATWPTFRAAALGRKASREDFTPRSSFSLPMSMYTEKMKPITAAKTPEATLKVTPTSEERKSRSTSVRLESKVLQLNPARNSSMKVRSFSWAKLFSQAMALLKYTGAFCCTVSASTLRDSTIPGMMKAAMNTITRATTRYASATERGRRTLAQALDLESRKGRKATSSKKWTNTLRM